ncbi:amino acid adenylation domain-containing protein [Streptomyces sp. NPDC058646]|uniref:amino acid adenylation domain-containing protein n=1 Tax=Streptomyces sp. NPDC058646 TaxID=3346574 RepID=UPI0036537065
MPDAAVPDSGRTSEGRDSRLSRLTPEQRARFEERIRGRGAAPAAASAAPAPVQRRDRSVPAPLSFGQERLWFLEQLNPGLAVFNEYAALRLRGALDVPALQGALDALVDRHEALRTVVATGEEGPVQRVLEDAAAAGFALRVVDLPADPAAEQAAAEAEAAQPFDLVAGPLFRALLLRSAPDHALLVITNHHLVGDAWSRSVLIDDLRAHYAAALSDGSRPAPLGVQYADWAERQRRELTDEALAAPLAYWREQLEGAPHLLALATDRPRPAVPSYRGGRIHFTLDAATTAAVDELARSARATPFMVTLAAWQAVLMRHSGQEDVVVGVPTAGRTSAESESMVGMFVNSLVVRSDLSGDPSFAALLGRVRESVLSALAHQQVPFERLVQELRPERDLSYAPLYQVQFGYRNVPERELGLPGVAMEVVDLDNGVCRGDLTLELARDGDLTRGVCEFSRDLFDAETAREWTATLARVVRSATAEPDRALSELLALSPAEAAVLDLPNDTAAAVTAEDGVLPGFARQVRERPGAPALICGPEELTYGQLDARIADTAARLRAAGAGPGTLVGLCLRRGTDLVVSMLAVLRAGAAYLPMDPSYPAARLAHMVHDARPVLVVVHAGSRAAAPAETTLLDLDLGSDAVAAPVDPAAEPHAASPDSPAYVIYTSGSTGTPKGVVVRRRNLDNFLVAMDDVVGAGEPVGWLAVTSVSFDISVVELLWTLSRGHRVVLSPDPEAASALPAVPAAGPDLSGGPAESGPEFSLFYFSSAQPESGPGPEQYRLLMEGAAFADAHGFSGVWMPERHFHAFGGPFPAPSVLAAAVAAATSRIGLRAGSVVLPLHHPVRVAEEWSVVDNLSGGRVGLSFASGWHVDDFVLAKDAYDRRNELLVSGIDEVRRLWRGEQVPFEAPGGRSVDIAVLPRPVQPELPFWLTSSGNPETCRRAGEIGARLLTHLLGQSVEDLAERITTYREAWRAAGHAGEPHVTLMLHSYVGTDAEDVRARAREPFRAYLRSSLGLIENMARGLGMDIRSADFTPEDLEALLDHACARYMRDGSLIGTAEDCLPLVERLSAIGVDELACLVDFGVDTDAVLASLPRLDSLRRAASAARGAVSSATAPAAEPLTALMRRHAVTHLQCTPSLARTLLDDADADALRGLRMLLLGGEPLDRELAQRLHERLDADIRNMYGPTETTVWSTTDSVAPGGAPVTIGRPLANTTVYVLDGHRRRVPAGVPGELHIGGAGVAAGYLDRPGLTAERFVPDTFAADPSARLYRTGDVVRTLRDGRLEYLSRTDHQVKIRGFRVETGEVEAALAALPAVRQAVVTAHGLGTDRAALTAYVVPAGPATEAGALRAALSEQLPAFLVPSRFVLLDAFPLTSNGKVDRAALPEPGTALAGRPYTAPVSATEREIAEIWRVALEADRVGRHDDFFELGGHSLLATQVLARIRQDLAVQLPLRVFFTSPTVADLARTVEELRAAAAPGAEPSAVVLRSDPGARHEPFPLTDVQRAYWIGRSGAVGGDVSCHLYVELDVADVDLDRLQDAWRALVRRHDALRLVVDADGTQRVLESVPDYVVDGEDLGALDSAARADRLERLRDTMSHQVLPSDRWPLFDLRASRLGSGRVRLHLSIDTLIADGGSVRILLGELLAVYQGKLTPGPLELTFRDYVVADQQRRQGEDFERDLAYWQERLETLPPAPRLPLRTQPEMLAQTRFGRREEYLPADVWDRLKARAAKERITPSAVALTAYAQILGTWSADDRFTLNLTLFNRIGDHPDLPSLVGDFTALSLFEVDGGCRGAFGERARRLQKRLWEDLEHRLVSGVRVARELMQRRGAAEAAMPVVFTSELGAAEDGGGAALRELGAEVVHTITQTPQVWLDHQISEDAGRLRLTWDAVEALFPAGMLDDMFAAYTALLRALADEDGCWDDEHHSVLPARQQDAYRALNATGGPVPSGLLHEPFLAQAAARPDRPAVVSATGTVTYAELERASAAVARAVRAAGAGPNDVVGVLLGRGWEQAAACLGILRAGAAYLPLDARLPAARVERTLRHAGAVGAVVLPEGSASAQLPSDVARIVFDPAAPHGGEPEVLSAATADDLAYVIYTSGSTGEPKGVLIDHRGALNTVTDINERFRVGPQDRVFGISALGFDLSVYDLFGTFAAGATLVMPGDDEDRDPVRWAQAVAEHGVTVWNSVPALMEMLLTHALGNTAADVESLRLVMLSGDWIPVAMPGQIREISPKAQVISLGGATEASIWSVLHPVDRVDPERPSIPYGRPMRNQSMYVLDEMFRPCPVWVPGQLFIGGIGLALGYHRAPELTGRAFPTHPVTGERLYRTGDLARLMPDGTLEFLGREDSQVKVRGMRIELGEIEAALVRTDGVREAAALVEGSGTAAELVAYVVEDRTDERAQGPAGGAGGGRFDAERLRHLELRMRQPGRRTDLADREALPFHEPADAAVLRAEAAVRGSADAFGRGPAGAAALHALLAVLARQDESGVPKYGYGSAGGLYPVQVYVHVAPGGVAGVPAGTYYFDPAGPALVGLRQDVGYEPDLFGPANRELAGAAGFGIYLVSRSSVISPVYGGLADRFCLLEAGAMAQLLRQRAAACGLALRPVGDVHAEPLRDALCLEEGQSVLHSMIGGPAVTTQDGAGLEERLRAALADRLPVYMVPRRIHAVGALPLSGNGKVDRKALARRAATAPERAAVPAAVPAAAAPAAVPAVLAAAGVPGAPASLPGAAPLALAAAGSGSTGLLVRLWHEVLGEESIGLDTNFFELGANSIHLVRVQRRISEEFGREVPVLELFERPTIRSLAALLDEQGPSGTGGTPGTPAPGVTAPVTTTPGTASPEVTAPGTAAPAAAALDGASAGQQPPARSQHHERRRSARRGGSGKGTTA